MIFINKVKMTKLVRIFMNKIKWTHFPKDLPPHPIAKKIIKLFESSSNDIDSSIYGQSGSISDATKFDKQVEDFEILLRFVEFFVFSGMNAVRV